MFGESNRNFEDCTKNICEGRDLEISNPNSPPPLGKTTTAFDEIRNINNLFLTLEVQFYMEVSYSKYFSFQLNNYYMVFFFKTIMSMILVLFVGAPVSSNLLKLRNHTFKTVKRIYYGILSLFSIKIDEDFGGPRK